MVLKSKNLSTQFGLSSKVLTLEKTRIQTSASSIEFDGRIKYNDFASFSSSFLDGNSSLKFQNSTISKEDLTYFIDEQSIQDINIQPLDKVQFDGNVSLNEGSLHARNLSIQSGSELTLEGSIHTANILDLTSTTLSFDISKIKTSQASIERLFPTLKFPNELNNLGTLNGRLKGKLTQNQLSFEGISLHTSEGTSFSGHGNIYNLQEPKDLVFKLEFTELKTNIKSLFSDKLNLPDELQRLENIQYEGLVEGDIHKIGTKGKLSTSLGNVELDSKINFTEDYSDANYVGYINTSEFDVGAMLNDTTFGIVNFEGNLEGSGLSIDKLKTSIDGKIASIYYDGNTYEENCIGWSLCGQCI